MKRHRRIRIHPSGILFCIIVCAVLIGTALLVGRACNADKPAVQVSVSSPAPSVVPEPTAETTSSPAPTAEPRITAAWYQARNARLLRDLTAYGGYGSDAEVRAAILLMDIDPDGKMVALTFDDGPNPKHTQQILDVLKRYNARATFFVLGNHIDGNESLLQNMLAIGCEIGNHTQAHTNLRDVPIDEARRCIVQVNEKIKQLFDYDVCLLRPPYGSYKTDDDRIKLLAKDLGMSIIMWRRSVHDSHVPTPSPDEIYARALLEIDEEGGRLNGAILLFHDKYDQTVEAIALIVPALQAQGYQLVTVSELLRTEEGGMNPGGVYRCKG